MRGGGGRSVPRYPALRRVSCSWEGKGPGCPCASLSACRVTLRELGSLGAGKWGPHHSPSLATSPMGTLCFWAMYPRKERPTKPADSSES